MDKYSLQLEKNRILELRKEIASLEDKKAELSELEDRYGFDYFRIEREEYAHLIEIPEYYGGKQHIMTPYSILNVDLIGYMIAILFYDYEHKEMVAKRVVTHDELIGYNRENNRNEKYSVKIPKLIIENLHDRNDTIEIAYDTFYDGVNEYPTDNPTVWVTSPSGCEYTASNYDCLINYFGELSFDYKENEFIKELVYSMAYYQKQHDITYMDVDKTWDVFKKIYKK